MGDAHFSETKGNVFRKRKTKWPGSYRCARQMGSRWSPSSRRSQWWPWCQRWPSWILKSWGQPSHWGCGVSWIPARKGIGGQAAGVQLFQEAWQPHSLRAICTFHAQFQKNDSRHKKKMARFWKRNYQKDLFNLLDKCTTCSPYISRFGFQSCFSVPASSVLSLAGPVRLALHTGLCWGEKIMAEDFRKNIFLHMYASFGQNQQLKMVWA